MFQEYFDEPILTVTDASVGMDQEVKIIDTESGKYVFKRPKKEYEILANEIFGCTFWGRHGVVVPSIIRQGKDFLIQSFIAGEVPRSRDDFIAVGELLKKMHAAPMTGYGPIRDGRGEFSTAQEYVQSILSNAFPKLRKNGIFSTEELAGIETYFRLHAPRNVQPVLIHHDFSPAHVRIKDGIAGVFDFGDVKSSDPMEDFRLFYVYQYGTEVWVWLKEGYGPVDEAAIEYYALLNMIWKLRRGFEREREKDMLQRMIPHVRRIIHQT